MSTLVTCAALCKSFGVQRLFNSLTFSVHRGDRLGIIGPNGSGKSTLLKILCQKEEADDGEIFYVGFCRISYLSQKDFFDDTATLTENLYAALEKEEMEDVEKYTAISKLLGRAEFSESDIKVGELSGGWRKRLAICRAMLTSPDLLVLDEPTNHLDIAGILWLEKMLAGLSPSTACLVVSHDRRFLENSTNRIMEISAVYPSGSLQVNGNYTVFLEKRAEILAEQKDEELRLANKARREIEWLRRGPKARATKAKYRIDEAHKLQDNLTDVQSRNRLLQDVQIDFSATGRKTKKLLELQNGTKGWEGRRLFSGLNMILSPGSRLGLLGNNGCGKTTLMKILAAGGDGSTGDALDSGTLRLADKVQIVHFDQRRDGLEPEISLRRALAPDGDAVVFRGRSLHVASWAKKFLFRPEQLETPVGQLSGGEQARILIAALMRQPADILLLDEPTNDLDIASLDVLEASLVDFPGALVLVSHDRFLLDRLCDRVLGFDGCGEVEFYADYRQWLDKMESLAAEKRSHTRQQEKKKPANPVKKEKLSYLDQREYDQMEEKLLVAEAGVAALEEEMALPEVAADSSRLDACWQKLEAAKAEVDRLYERWDELEEKRSA